jgi:hypothetical protein
MTCPYYCGHQKLQIETEKLLSHCDDDGDGGNGKDEGEDDYDNNNNN